MDFTQDKHEPVAMPVAPTTFDRSKVRPQWDHPFLALRQLSGKSTLSEEELQSLAYHYYLRFLPLFRNQSEGSLAQGTMIEFSPRMKHQLGEARLFDGVIRLNQKYFARDPALLPYTLFHEMIHLWLYNCFLDPGHTKRFYRKMDTFKETGLPMDPAVHIHRRLSPEGRYIYVCDNCLNRWHMTTRPRKIMMCGYCFERENIQYYPHLIKGSLKGAIGLEVPDENPAPSYDRPGRLLGSLGREL